jgi:acetyl esterase/lipase
LVRAASTHHRFMGIFLAMVLAFGVLASVPGFGAASDDGVPAAAITEGEALEQAEQVGEPVQVLDLTTADTVVYANPDGTFTAELSSGPVRVPDPSSPTGWSDVDVSLEEGPDGLQPQVAEADITFSDGGPGQAATIAEDGLSFSVGTEEILPAPTVSGDTATYQEVLPGIDLTLQARPGGFEQSYLIEAPPAEGLVFDLPLSLVGVEVAVQKGGNLVVTDEAGNVVAQASPAVMFGAEVDPHTDEPVHSALVDTAIVQTEGGPVLRVSPDPGFFSTPGLAYPVTVDPAPDFSVDVDTFVSSASPTTAYGSDQQLKSGVNGSDVHRTLVSFSGTGVLMDNRILSARLKLWETHSYSCTDSLVQVYEATGSFTSLTTWNTQPVTGTMYASATEAFGFSASCPNDWLNLSTGGADDRTLAILVQEWAWGTKTPYGLIVKAGSETNPEGWKKFSSSDAGSNAPVLSVTYEVTAPDASDSEDGYTGWSQDILSSPQNYVTDQLGGVCEEDRPGSGSDGSYTYKLFDEYGASTEDIPLKVSEFDPARMGGFPTEEYPLLVLVHGGGWVAGCRATVAKEAKLFTGDTPLQRTGELIRQQFIVLSADHRMACEHGSYPEIPLSVLPELCGWRWDTPDPEVNNQTQVAVHDIEDVIRWVRNTDGGWQDQAGSDYNRWNGDIFVLGASAGGNLVAQTAANSAGDSGIKPTAAAFLSGFPETGKSDNPDGDWSCSSGSSNQDDCWIHLNNYLNCGVVDGVGPPEAVTACKGTNGRYEEASPLNGGWNATLTPPMFIANAGYPLVGGTNKDLSPLQLAIDFRDKLDGDGGYTLGTNLELCEVESGGHATGYLDKWSPNQRFCVGFYPSGDEVEVIESLVDFFDAQTAEW